jgi:replication factor C small subunit
MNSEVKMNPNEWLWVEKYRPTTLDEVIAPDEIKNVFQGIIDSGQIPNLLLSGSAGIGKTTLAKALCDIIGADWILINASLENGIDVLRTKITQFASTTSFEGNKKVVICDEADHITAAAQAGFRAFIEEFSNNCTFIFTCNFKNRLIEAIHSRCKTIEFKVSNKDKPALAAQFFKRVTQILKEEEIEFDKKVVAEIVNKHFPDFRRVLNELQSYAASGKIDSGILVNLTDDSFNELIKILKAKKFNDMRRWVAQHADDDSSALFKNFYDKAVEYLEPKSIPELIILLGEYQYKAQFVANQEINTSAFLTEVMMSDAQWK